jgi:threonine dehydrogenase-like Zn-dependent dehydrogenase
MKDGDILGHEFMGEVVEVGRLEPEAQGRSARGGAIRHRVR